MKQKNSSKNTLTYRSVRSSPSTTTRRKPRANKTQTLVLLFASIHELGIFSKVLHLLFDTESKFPFFSCFVSFLVPVFVWFYFLFVGILKYTDSPIFDRFGHDCVPLVLKLFEFLVIDEGSLPSHFVHHAHFLVGGGHMGFVGIEFHSFMIL